MCKLSNKEVSDIASEVSRNLLKDMDDKEKNSPFFIPPKDHYDHHHNLSKLFDMMEDAGGTLFKTIILLVCFGILALIMLGFHWESVGAAEKILHK